MQSYVILQAKRGILFLQNVPLLIKKEKKKRINTSIWTETGLHINTEVSVKCQNGVVF